MAPLLRSDTAPFLHHIHLYHPIAPLPRSDKTPFLHHIRTTGLHLVSLPSTACISTRTRPLPVSPSSDWLRLFWGHTFYRINTPKISSRLGLAWLGLTQLFFLLTPSMKMESSVPKRRHTKFRHQGITQKKEYKIQTDVFLHWLLDQPIFYSDIETVYREKIMLNLGNMFFVMNTRYCQFTSSSSSLHAAFLHSGPYSTNCFNYVSPLTSNCWEYMY